MKIAVISDLHLGYSRFEEDSYAQPERMIEEAMQKADALIVAGDLFDSRVPKIESIRHAVEIFKKSKIPVIAIHGNHERRTKGFDNPINILASAEVIDYLNCSERLLEKDGEKVAIFGVGSVPEEYAEEEIKKAIDGYKAPDGAFKILVLHQNINELVNQNGMTLDFLNKLPFDFIINGHIHKRYVKLDGKLLIPGSTVITQLKKEEMEPKGYYLLDTATGKCEFFEVATRKFFYEELKFTNATEKEVLDAIDAKIGGIRKDQPAAIISLKLTGSLREGLKASDIRLNIDDPLVFASNELNVADLKDKIEEIKRIRDSNMSVREFGRMELERRLKGKLKLFKPSELFEKLVEDQETATAYLEEIIQKETQG
ncbi:MAG: DNA repair exonuclease [Candidatus Micrarchaeota archaeon]